MKISMQACTIRHASCSFTLRLRQFHIEKNPCTRMLTILSAYANHLDPRSNGLGFGPGDGKQAEIRNKNNHSLMTTHTYLLVVAWLMCNCV